MNLNKRWTAGPAGNKDGSCLGGASLEQIRREVGSCSLQMGLVGTFRENSFGELGCFYAHGQPRMPGLAAGVNPTTLGGGTLGAALVAVEGDKAGLRTLDSASVKTCGIIISKISRAFTVAALAPGFLSSCSGLVGFSAEQDVENRDSS